MKEQDLGSGRVNSMIGTALGFGLISPKMVPYCFGIFLLCSPLILRNPAQGLLIFACVYGFFWALTGNDPVKFFERLNRPKKYIASEPTLKLNRAGIPKPNEPKRTVTTYRIKGKKIKHHHIERKFHFLTYGQIELDNKKIGFYLLRRGPQLMFIFAWDVFGRDPSMTGDQAFSMLEASNDALIGLPVDVDLKCYQDITRSSEDYLRLQAALLTSKERDPLSRELIVSRAKRAKQLSEEGRLLHNQITILAKYRVVLGGDYAVTRTWMDDLLSKTQPLVGSIAGKDFDSQQAWEKVIDYAYSHAYQKVNFLLSDSKGFGMRVRTLTVNELFKRDYLELHHPPVPETPHYILYNRNGLQPPVLGNLGTHALGVLFEAQNGYPATPSFDRHYAHLRIVDKYAAFVRLGQIQKFPLDKKNVARGYLRYVYNILSGTSKPIFDCRFVSELTADRSGFEFFQLDRIISNSTKRQALAAKKQTVDVVAMRRLEQGIEARDLLEENNLPYWCSAGFWLYRDSPDELEEDISNLLQQIPTASVERCENNTEAAWFGQWAFEWESFLTKPNHNRQKYLSFQALPLMPTIKVKSVDKRGVMLVTRELNSPVYIDIANRKNHTAIIAKSGTGKSNLMLDTIVEYILDDHLAVIFDFPRPDGTSTYSILVPLLQKLGVKAAYHNIRESRMNIVELPDLRRVKDAQEYRERWKRTFDNHLDLLCALVMGTTNNPDREVLVKSLLTTCYADFHADETIKHRYEQAIEGGFGSDAYQKMPVLEDFVDFADNWFKKLVESEKETISNLKKDTIDIIVTQLRGVLKTSLGDSINGISSFDTNVNFLVIALTGVSENLDSLIYAMAGLNVLYRGTLSAKRSLLGTDEGTILYKFPFYARATGVIPVHGRKWGCNFLIAAQEIKTILNSCSGNEIFNNLDNIFCGHLEDQAIPEMLQELNFRSELLKPYSSEAFKPSLELLQSYWYLKRGDQHLEVTHPASEMTLALGATDPDEDAARKRVMAMYPEDDIAGLKQFALLNASAKRQGLSMDSICPETDDDEQAA